MLRSAQVGAGVAAGGLAGELVALPQPAFGFHGAEHRALAPPGLAAAAAQDADYWRFADWLAPVLRRAVARRPLALRLGQQHRRAASTTTRCCSRPTRSPRWPVTTARAATTTARARWRGGCASRRPGASATPRPRATRSSTTPAGSRASAHATRRWTSRSTRRSRRRSCTRGGRATRCGCRDETIALIADRISRCARGPFFRFPERAPEPDQLELRAVRAPRHRHRRHGAAANDYRAQVARFCDGIPRALAPGGSPNLGPGYRFHYLPHRPPAHPFNLDSAEYASETCHFILYHEQALRAGMALLAPGALPPAAGLGRAHRVPLLDSRRLPELGHRLRLQALARGPHLGARAAGTARDRRLAAVPQRAGARRRGRSTCSIAASGSTSGCRARRRTRRASRPRTSTT